jgi:hypothetical protein
VNDGLFLSGRWLRKRRGVSRPMSALGQNRTCAPQKVMSGLPPSSGHVRCTRRCLLWANSGHSVPSRFLRCSSSSRLLENNWAFLHISRAGSPGAGSHSIRWFISSRRSLETVRNGESDVASSSPCVGRYTQGAPQRRLHRARKRPGRRRVDGAAQAGLVAVRTAPRS